MYDHYFSNFGRPPVLDDLCKDSAKRLCSGEDDFFKVFTIYGHGGHLGQWTATILAILHSPAPGRLQMKFEQHWPRGSRGGHLKFSTFGMYSNNEGQEQSVPMQSNQDLWTYTLSLYTNIKKSHNQTV